MSVFSNKDITCHWSNLNKNCNTLSYPGCILNLCMHCDKICCSNCMVNNKICRACDYYLKKYKVCQYCASKTIISDAEIHKFKYDILSDNYIEHPNGLLCRKCQAYTCTDCCSNKTLSQDNKSVCFNCLIKDFDIYNYIKTSR